MQRYSMAGAGPESRGPASPKPMVARELDEWARLWFSAVRHPWLSLVLVPASVETSALAAARALTEAAAGYGLRPVRLIDATQVEPSGTGAIIGTIADGTANGDQVVIAVASPEKSPVAIPIARAADAAALVVTLGVERMASARGAIAAVGAESFIGSVVVRSAR